MPLQSESAGITTEEVLLRLGIAVFLVLANGFFVAAEFALVGARTTRIEAMASKGNAGARMALRAIRHLDHYISGTQLGITLASLGLGWVGESTIASLLIQAFTPLPQPWDVVATHTVAGTIAFALITFMHIVLGELAPKSLAILFPERVSIWTAGPLIAFSRIFSPFIVVLNGSANLLLRMLGLRAPHEAERVHRPEEIEMLLRKTQEHGLMAEEPAEMIRGVFDLSETTAAEVMTPRTEVVAVPITATMDEVADTFLDSGHSRLPVYEQTVDHIIGVVLARDFWRSRRDRRDAGLRQILRPVPFVPETKDLEDLLREMQREGTHIVVVLDEYGGTAGVVTVEDVIEQIVGEIADEHEELFAEIREEDGRIIVSGRALVSDLNERFGLQLPQEEYTTAAGMLMGMLGRIAEEGDRIEFAGGSMEVLSMSGRRIEWLELVLERTADSSAES
ncbi:MAG TPA: hemolysin family protein [Longimicrobiaceae bacterium]